MKIYDCACGATLFFDNDACLSCRRPLGFLPDRRTLAALEPADSQGAWRALVADGRAYRKCQNYAAEAVCNWMIAPGDDAPFCVACRLNETIPDLSDPANRAAWKKLEAAKRRLVYSLLALRLPIVGRAEAPDRGLAFAFLRETGGGGAPVMTGHADGLITINVTEADDVEREGAREQLHEPYRTLLGHFRHEIGHYYFAMLVDGSRWQDPFRAVFGDERQDYAAALQRHYAGPQPDWQERHISAYASSHPWEDWAETWAHYFHMVDTIETAAAFGVRSSGAAKDRIDEHLFGIAERRAPPRGWIAPDSAELTTILRDWVWLTLAANSISRSMGMRDVYPFVLNARVVQKLQLVHAVIVDAAGRLPTIVRRGLAAFPSPSSRGA